MPAKKAELQIPLKEILDHKEGQHGKMFKIKIAHYKPRTSTYVKAKKNATRQNFSDFA